MPAKIKVRCKYADCKFNQDYVCMNTEIELFPDQDCAMYEPVEVVAEEEDPEEDDELQEEEEDWLELEDEEDEDPPYGPGEE